MSLSAHHADYHIHLHHSPCTADEMTANAILAEAGSHGLHEVGLVNHLHPSTALEIFKDSREEINQARHLFSGQIFLGAELDLLDQSGNTSFREDIRSLVDYVTLAMGHYQLEWVSGDFTLEPDQFLMRELSSLMRALSQIKVDLLVHPFIYSAFPKLAPHYVGKLLPGNLPGQLIKELAEQLKAEKTAVEFHCRDLFVRPEGLGGARFVESYMVFLEKLRGHGVAFVQGSDAHRLNQIGRTKAAPAWAAGLLRASSQ
ncbi:MAG: hypothetical protein HQL45_00840 [Alphaproteobacteria bacterium]|nr:hypothetical protein [Alphaproteobacteria bacterium]MBF0353650.1 hypothetical protein [Alphaproteobacteria bacterium]